MRCLQVFEQQPILWEELLLTETQIESLLAFNQAKGNRYFKPIHKGIQFRSYVGVLQVGDLQLEILPKIDKFAVSDQAWRMVLLEMLGACYYLPIDPAVQVNLALDSKPLLSIYVEEFITQLELLAQQGWLRYYVQQASQQKYWKGQPLFSKQLRLQWKEPTHTYVRATHLDYDHIWNQLLYKAASLLNKHFLDYATKMRLEAILRGFPLQSSIEVSPDLFERLNYDRKTEPYRAAMNIAQLILLGNAPSLQSGSFLTLGILFDMNKLFEEYIYRQLQGAAQQYSNIEVYWQSSRKFWEEKSLRPDILLKIGAQQKVIDVKWKLLQEPNPNDADLRQIYAYVQSFDAAEGCLLYPTSAALKAYKGQFIDTEKSCRLLWVNVLQADGSLNKKVGESLLKLLIDSN